MSFSFMQINVHYLRLLSPCHKIDSLDILVDVGVGVICQDVVLCPQDFHGLLGIFLQLDQRRERLCSIITESATVC